MCELRYTNNMISHDLTNVVLQVNNVLYCILSPPMEGLMGLYGGAPQQMMSTSLGMF